MALDDAELESRIQDWPESARASFWQMRSIFFEKVVPEIGSRELVAETIGMKVNTLTNYLNAKKPFGQTLIDSFALILGENDPTKLISGYHQLPGHGRIPKTRHEILSVARSNEDVRLATAGVKLPEKVADFVPHQVPVEGTFIFVMPDSSMATTGYDSIPKGSYCVCNWKILPPQVGDLVIVEINKKITIREYCGSYVKALSAAKNAKKFEVLAIVCSIAPRNVLQ